uniref:Uncharacterized protein n=1 Tax=Arundo donax TaxID=35708 RepID=A0A0A9GDQ5_ARUDO
MMVGTAWRCPLCVVRDTGDGVSAIAKLARRFRFMVSPAVFPTE